MICAFFFQVQNETDSLFPPSRFEPVDSLCPQAGTGGDGGGDFLINRRSLYLRRTDALLVMVAAFRPLGYESSAIGWSKRVLESILFFVSALFLLPMATQMFRGISRREENQGFFYHELNASST